MRALGLGTPASSWYLAFVLISAFLCIATVFSPELPAPLKLLSLRNEANFGALFSGGLLMLIALHAFDGWASERDENGRLAKAWLSLGFVMIALSCDEIGSLHERILADSWWPLAPFAVVFLALVGYAVATFWRYAELRNSAILIGLAFSLFASVALQEYVEHNVDWSANRYLRFFEARLRPVIEEGTELLGMLILLKVCMKNTGGCLGRGERSNYPVFEIVASWRNWLTAAGVVAAPLVAYGTVRLPPNNYGHGQPADWPAVAFFWLASIAIARPVFITGRTIGPARWALVLLALLGSAITTLPADSSKFVLLLGALSVTVFAIWSLWPGLAAADYVPAGVALTIALAGSWLIGENELAGLILCQYVGLALYWVHASPTGTAYPRPGPR